MVPHDKNYILIVGESRVGVACEETKPLLVFHCISSVIYIWATVYEIYFRKVFIERFTFCVVNLTVANARAVYSGIYTWQLNLFFFSYA
jgi:hypothetical protein